MDKIEIRKAVASDVELIYELVKNLATFENAPLEVSSTIEDYLENGFSENPLFDCFLLFENNQPVGFSLWYFRFSTWKGKRLYLEDLYIKEEFRGKGYGKLLMEETIKESKLSKSTGMMWQVLDWNIPAIEFYNKYDVRMDGEWINVNLEVHP